MVSAALLRASGLIVVACVGFGVWALGCGGGDGSGSPTGSAVVADGPAVEPVDPPTPGFRDHSGSTDIPAFGVEAGERDRAAAERVLSSYLRASGERDWRTACRWLFGTALGEISALAKGPERGLHRRCAEALPHVFELAPGPDPYLGPVRLAALRVRKEAGAGFALFHARDGNDYWAAMKMEEGMWMVLSPLPHRL